MSAFVSVREDGPTDRVASCLILEDECPDLLVELGALPVTLDPKRVGVAGVRSAHGSDRVGSCAEIVLGYVAHAGSLTGGVGGVASGSMQRASRTHRESTAGPSSHHRHITTGPPACRLDRVPRPRVRCLFVLEEVQYVFRTQGSPQGEAPMVTISERPATADGDQARIADLRQDHATSLPVEVRHQDVAESQRIAARANAMPPSGTRRQRAALDVGSSPDTSRTSPGAEQVTRRAEAQSFRHRSRFGEVPGELVRLVGITSKSHTFAAFLDPPAHYLDMER
jgi:hypothetical protein